MFAICLARPFQAFKYDRPAFFQNPSSHNYQIIEIIQNDNILVRMALMTEAPVVTIFLCMPQLSLAQTIPPEETSLIK